MRRSAVEGRRLLDFTCARDHHLGRRALVSYMVSDNYGKKQDDGQPSSETIILVWTIVLLVTDVLPGGHLPKSPDFEPCHPNGLPRSLGESI
jgi:hypothetical protein